MRLQAALRGAMVLALATALIAVPTAAIAGQQTYQYTFNEHHASDTFTDTGLCDESQTATISLVDYNEVLHVSATEAGLTQEQVEALLDQETDVITKLTYTQTGKIVATEQPSGITYTGHFTSWFGGNVNRNVQEFGGTFSIRVTGSDGSTVSGQDAGHLTFVNGEEVVNFDHGHFSGCPEA